VQPERDIFANASSSSESSAGALAAYLGRSCGHVWLDQRAIAQGYRFYPWMSDEIPHFFNKRFTSGTINLAVTLQAGMSLEGDDPLEDCSSHAEAKTIVENDDFAASLWLARVTVGTDMLDVADVAAPLFIAKRPAEFRLIAEELVSLGVLPAFSCPLCSEQENDDA
jgi:hypothetical protein